MRFKGFDKEWEKRSLENLINEIKEYTSDFDKYPLYSFTIESGITPKTERYERNFLVKKDGDLFKVVHPNNFVMNPMNLRFGAINYSKQSIDVAVSGYYDVFEIEKSYYNDFWNAYFKTPRIINIYNAIATGSLIEKKRVHFSQLKRLKLPLPSNDEKIRIDALIGLLDKRIELQNKIIEDLNTLSISITNEYCLSRKAIAKKNFTFYYMGDLLHERNAKKREESLEICSVSVSKGVINQTVYLGRSYAADNTSNYNVVYPNDIIYTKSPTGEFPYGIIKQSQKNKKVAVSPLYGVFVPKSKEIGNILHHYFKNSVNCNNYLCNLVQKGAKNTILISNQRFLDNGLYLPMDNKTILAVSKQLNLIDSKIKVESDLLSCLVLQKKYLLNNLFI